MFSIFVSWHSSFNPHWHIPHSQRTSEVKRLAERFHRVPAAPGQTKGVGQLVHVEFYFFVSGSALLKHVTPRQVRYYIPC